MAHQHNIGNTVPLCHAIKITTKLSIYISWKTILAREMKSIELMWRFAFFINLLSFFDDICHKRDRITRQTANTWTRHVLQRDFSENSARKTTAREECYWAGYWSKRRKYGIICSVKRTCQQNIVQQFNQLQHTVKTIASITFYLLPSLPVMNYDK